MFICLKCKNLFEKVAIWKEPHGELFAGSSCCKDDFMEAFMCTECGNYIDDDFIELLSDGSKYCLNCASRKELKNI